MCLRLRESQNFVYYESIKRELKRRLIYEYRRDERLKTKTEESTRLVDTGLVVELEHQRESQSFFYEGEKKRAAQIKICAALYFSPLVKKNSNFKKN
jgi:hypothetical protein